MLRRYRTFSSGGCVNREDRLSGLVRSRDMSLVTQVSRKLADNGKGCE